jgi:hypothetical protein
LFFFCFCFCFFFPPPDSQINRKFPPPLRPPASRGKRRARGEASGDAPGATDDGDPVTDQAYYQNSRRRRALYASPDLHATALELLRRLLVSPSGDLDRRYVSERPTEDGRIHVLHYLYHHVNHPANADVAAAVAGRCAEAGGGGNRLMKLLREAPGIDAPELSAGAPPRLERFLMLHNDFIFFFFLLLLPPTRPPFSSRPMISHSPIISLLASEAVPTAGLAAGPLAPLYPLSWRAGTSRR